MKKNSKIRVLILEDGEIQFALAGLLPFAPDGSNAVDIMRRVLLAKDTFEIQAVKSITEALEKLSHFTPDIAIIDVEIGTERIKTDKVDLENGIDFYRYLNQKFPVTQSILFTQYYDSPKYYAYLTLEERANFIPKARGTGYENLGLRISFYLKKVAQEISANTTPVVRKQIDADSIDQSFESIKEYEYSFGNRKFKPKHLLLFCAYPVLVGEIGQLEYQKPNEEFRRLIETNIFTVGDKYRKEWLEYYLQNAIDHYTEILQGEYEDKIGNSVKLFFHILDQNIANHPDKRFLGIDFGDFRTREYSEYDLLENSSFLRKFLNTLIVRRILFILELTMRETVDNRKSTTKGGKYYDFLRGFFSETMSGLKSNPVLGSADLQQLLIDLNLAVKIDKKHGSRECVDIEKYKVFDFEIKWLASEECQLIKNSLKSKILIT